MKPFFIFYCILLTLQSKAANDTLTRAQVYNFNVGDTFDYKLNWTYHDFNTDTIIWQQTYYTRAVITRKYYSQSVDTLFIVRQNFSSRIVDTLENAGMDTIVIDSLSLCQVAHEIFATGASSYSLSIDTFYNNRVVNLLILQQLCNCSYAINYSIGLGIAKCVSRSSDGFSFRQEYDTTLIYYSKNSETWGTPATIAISVGIPNIPQQNPSITLFPTVNNGQFKLSIDDPNNPSHQLIIYDLTGREVKRTNVASGTNNVTLDNASTGMYLWGVTSNGAILKSGKLIIQ